MQNINLINGVISKMHWEDNLIDFSIYITKLETLNQDIKICFKKCIEVNNKITAQLHQRNISELDNCYFKISRHLKIGLPGFYANGRQYYKYEFYANGFMIPFLSVVCLEVEI